MSATLDLILERRQVRRRLAIWRILAIVAIVLAAVAVIPQASGPITGDHLARIRVDGVIREDPLRDKALAKLAKSERIKGLIVHVNSPGGAVAASEALYEQIRSIGADRPVVAVMSEVAASGGYATAIAADHIVARGNSLTGSIGVLTQSASIKGLMEKVGVTMSRVKSAPLKAEPSITEPASEEVLAAQRELIADTFAWFKGLVGERRALSGAELDVVTDGRIFTGRQALANGLIDAIGDEATALAWLKAEHGIDEEMTIVDYDWTESPLPWPASNLKESVAAWFSQDPIIPVGPRLYAVIQ